MNVDEKLASSPSEGVRRTFAGLGRRLSGPSVFIVGSLPRGLPRATQAAVMQALHLQNLVPPVALFSVELAELGRFLVVCSPCMGQVAPEDGAMQIAIETGADYRFAGLNAQLFARRNMRPLPFDGSGELSRAFQDIALDQTQATACPRNEGPIVCALCC